MGGIELFLWPRPPVSPSNSFFSDCDWDKKLFCCNHGMNFKRIRPHVFFQSPESFRTLEPVLFLSSFISALFLIVELRENIFVCVLKFFGFLAVVEESYFMA